MPATVTPLRPPPRTDLPHWDREVRRLFVAGRHALGLTQEQAAPKLGVDRRTVGRWESGERRIPAAALLKVLTRFRVEHVKQLCAALDLLKEAA